MKVFISHQKQDEFAARRVASRLLQRHQIESYLDVIDPFVGGPIELLADHIREEMGKCTQLIAVISSSTAQSQWVPWEVGVATEKNFPLATFADGNALPPEFLRKWPYLRSDSDLDEYARAAKGADRAYRTATLQMNEARARATSTRRFYGELRAALRQG